MIDVSSKPIMRSVITYRIVLSVIALYYSLHIINEWIRGNKTLTGLRLQHLYYVLQSSISSEDSSSSARRSPLVDTGLSHRMSWRTVSSCLHPLTSCYLYSHDVCLAHVHWKTNLLGDSIEVSEHCAKVFQPFCYDDYIIDKPMMSDVFDIDVNIIHIHFNAQAWKHLSTQRWTVLDK